MDSNIFVFNNYFFGTAHKKYVKIAIKELKEIDPNIKIIDRYPDGIFSFKSSLHKEVLIFKMQENPPIFLRHIHNIDRIIFVPNDLNTPDFISNSIMTISDYIKPGKKVAVQFRRMPGDYSYTLFTIKKVIDPIISKNFQAIPIVKRPQQIISVYVANSTAVNLKDSPSYEANFKSQKADKAWKEVCFIGVGNPRDNLNEWAGGEVRFPKSEEQTSKAELKLLEAFEVFKINIKSTGKALDLGSSPGGWARVLHKMGFLVTAVDRAPLDSEIQSLKGVRFIKKDALHFRDNNCLYDILTNDINHDSKQSAKAIISSAPSIKEGAPLIWTIKLQGKNFNKIIQNAVSKIKPYFEIKGIKQLYHNKDEVTLWGIKK